MGCSRTPAGPAKPSPRRSLFSHQQGTIFEKLGIWTMPEFVRFMHDLKPVKEDPDVVTTHLCFGTIPVRLYQPKVASCTPRRGIVFYHGGGAVFGSLSKSPSPRPLRPVVCGGGVGEGEAGGTRAIFLGSRSLYIMTRGHQGS